MIKGTKDFLDQIVKTHVCPEHGARLCIAWHAEENSYVIRCGEGHYPEEVTRELSPTQQYKEGTLPAVGPPLDLMPKADLGTGELLTPAAQEGLIRYAKRYGLDAYRGHVMLMYGLPYIGIDGYLYHANKTGEPYTLLSQPFTDTQRKEYMIPDEAHAWLATVRILSTEAEYTGLGIVTQEEMTAKSKRDTSKLASPVVAAHPWQLAQKRSEWQALRRAFPIGETDYKEEV